MKLPSNGNKLFSKRNIILMLFLLVIVTALPVGIYLVQKTQILKSRASVPDPLQSCANRFIFNFNGPSNDKIRQLYTYPSIKSIAIAWKEIQPTQDSSLDFTKLENDITAVISQGQTPSVTFCDGDCFPDWARQMDRSIDREYCCSTEYVCRVLKDDEAIVQAFTEVVRAMVSKYKDRVSYWDYGIEPNCRGESPDRYTRWLKDFSEAVHSVDLQAIVIGGHLSGANTDYLSAMYDNGAGPYFDRLSVDPYGPSDAPFDIAGLERLRNFMVERGDENKKIWLGEWAVSSGDSEERQASVIEQSLNYLASHDWIEAASYHNFECEDWASNCSPGSPGYLGYALLKSDGTEKLAYQVFKKAVSYCTVKPSTNPELGQITIKLTRGLNLISIPRPLVNPLISSAFAKFTDIDRVYYYDLLAPGNWDRAEFYSGEWIGNLKEIETGKGYWIRALMDTNLTLDLASPQNPLPEYPLSVGWNLIGYTTNDLTGSMPVDDYLGSIRGKWDNIYGYDTPGNLLVASPTSGGGDFNKVELGHGYWIYMSEPGTLIPP